MSEQSNAITVAQDEQVQGSEGGAAPMPVDPAIAAKMEKDDHGLARIVELAIATLDPKDRLKKYARLGKAALDHAIWQKRHFPTFAKEDFDRLCDQVTQQVKLTVPIKIVEIAAYIRLHVWIEAVKPMVPDVDALSYHQAKNIFLPLVSFSKTELTGKIKDGWVDFVRDHVTLQLSDTPMPVKELHAAVAAHGAKLEADRNPQKTPGQLADAEHKKQVAERTAKENKVRTAITTGVDEALGGVLDANAVMAIVEKVAQDRGINLPAGNLATLAGMKPDEAGLLLDAMWRAGNIASIKRLRDKADFMVKQFENAATTSKVAS